MYKKLFTLISLVLLSFHSNATFTPVTLTGFTSDIIANGVGNASASTTADVDGGNYVFVAHNFKATPTSSAPTYSLPDNGTLTSALTSGLTFQLASYSGNNALRLPSTDTGTLYFATPQTAGDVYVLCTSGSGQSTATFTVNFTNGTSQTFTGIDVSDWYGGNGSVNAIGRVNTSNNNLEGNSSDPKLYEVKLSLSSTNYANQIANIHVEKTSSGGEILVVMGVSVNDVCSGTPTAGSTAALDTTICSGKTATLSLSGATNSAGLGYQWQTFNGTAWTNITGATSSTFTSDPLTAATQFRCAITCVASTQTVNSTPLTINVSSFVTPPYTETFESITQNNDLPNCMTATNVGDKVFTYTNATGSYNQSNHTFGGSKFASFQYGCTDTIFTPALNLTAGQLYRISFWYITDGLGGWNTLGAAYGTAANGAAMTHIIGTPIASPGNTTYQQYVDTFTAPTSGIYFVGIFCQANSVPWYLSLDDINIAPFSPCTGAPVAGTAHASNTSICAGNSVNLSLTGTTVASGLTYQWQTYNGTAWVSATGGTGATTDNYTTAGLTGINKFRCAVTCTASSQTAYSDTLTITSSAVIIPPYLETFESINNDDDLPSCMSATNLGDDVTTYTSPTGSYNQINHTFGGSKYASFSYGSEDTVFTPAIQLTAGQPYQVSFWYITDGYGGWDSLGVMMGNAQNSAAMITPIGTPVYGPNNTTYQQFTATYTPTTSGVYFMGIYCEAGYSPEELTIDDIQIIPFSPCTGAPNGGIVQASNNNICVGASTVLLDSGATYTNGITYQWEMYNGTAWASVTGGSGATTRMYTTAALSATTQFRCKVTCATGSSVYSDTFQVNVQAVHTIPYTEDFESISNDGELPNCMTATNFGTKVNTYTSDEDYNRTNHTTGGSKYAAFHWSCDDYLFTPSLSLNAGQTYKFSFWYNTDGYGGWNTLQAKFGTSPTAAAMTTNIGTAISNPTNMTYQQYTGTFTPTTSGTYYVGIYCNANSVPYYLSVDDLNLDIAPCNGAPTVGTATASVTGGCAATNYTVNLVGTSTTSGIHLQWQSATSAIGPWTNLDTTVSMSVNGITATTYYRAYASCMNSGLGDTSNVVTVNKYPLSFAATANTPVCAGTTLTLGTNTPTPGATYSWTGPNGFTASTATATIPTVTTAASGRYLLTTAINGCTDTSSVEADITPIPTFTTASTDPTTCGGTEGSITLSGLTASTTYSLTYSRNTTAVPAANITTDASGNYTITGLAAATYTDIIVTQTGSTCNSLPAGPVTLANPVVLPDPTADNNGPLCEGATLNLEATSGLAGVDYHWSGPGGFSTTTQNPVISNAAITASGVYTVYTTYQSCTSAQVTTTVVVNAKPVATVTAAGNTTICQGDNIVLEANTGNGFVYQWMNNNNPISGAVNDNYVANTNGSYSVIIQNASGCIDTSATVDVTVITAPVSVISYTGSLTICAGKSIMLSAPSGAGYSYQWYKDGVAISGETNLDYAAVADGTYTLRVTAGSGCFAFSNGVTVTVVPPTYPIISESGNTLSTSGFTAYQWYLNNNPIPGATSASYTVTQNGFYTVQGTDAGGCATMSAIASVQGLSVGSLTINEKDVQIYPNPAADMIHIKAPASLNTQIRNVQGQLILTKAGVNDINVSGIANGVYMITLTDADGNTVKVERLVIMH